MLRSAPTGLATVAGFFVWARMGYDDSMEAPACIGADFINAQLSAVN